MYTLQNLITQIIHIQIRHYRSYHTKPTELYVFYEQNLVKLTKSIICKQTILIAFKQITLIKWYRSYRSYVNGP